MKEKIKTIFEPKPVVEEADYIAYLEREIKAISKLKDEAIELHKHAKEEVKRIKSEIMKARTIKGLKEALNMK